jgi:hypothetical protein
MIKKKNKVKQIYSSRRKAQILAMIEASTGFIDKLYEVTRPTGHSGDDAEDS